MKSISALVIGKQWDIVTQRLLHQSFNKMLSNLGVRRSVSLLSEVSYFKQKRHEKDCNRYQNSKPADGYGCSCWEIVFTLFPPQKRMEKCTAQPPQDTSGKNQNRIPAIGTLSCGNQSFYPVVSVAPMFADKVDFFPSGLILSGCRIPCA